jgi:hypothetical protein
VPFSEKLAAQLNRVVPDEVALVAVPGGSIKIVGGALREGWVEVQWWWPQEQPEAFALNVLATLQELIFEEAADGLAWPSPEVYSPTRLLPEPHTEVAQGAVICWFGSRENPDVLVPPVPLDAE